MNREEIEWITQNLFVGNKLWSGGVKAGPSGALDLRNIKVPIVLFASGRQHHAAAASIQLGR